MSDHLLTTRIPPLDVVHIHMLALSAVTLTIATRLTYAHRFLTIHVPHTTMHHRK